MAITPKYSWPIPDASDAPNVPFDMNALAVAQETTVGGIQDYWTQLGIAGYRIEARSVVGPANGSFKIPVTFAKAFAVAPVVVFIPGDASAVSTTKAFYAMSVTTTGFIAGDFNAGETGRVNYIAIGPAVAVAATGATATVEQFITYEIQP